MKFSIYCNMKEDYLKNDNTYEIRVPYTQRAQILDLVPLEKRIVLECPEYLSDIKELIEFNEMCQGNFVVGILSTSILNELKENNIKYYFNIYASDFEDIYDYKYNYKVESILLSDELAFSYGKIKDFDLDIRLCPHSISRMIKYFDISRSFFIRPEDIHYYKDAILYIGDYKDPERASALYDIYLREDFQGKLFEIIPQLNENIENKLILDSFGKRRLNCDHECLKTPVAKCNLCYSAISLAQDARFIKEILEKK